MFGAAFDTLIFKGPQALNECIALKPEPRAPKGWRAEQMARGLNIITEAESASISDMHDELLFGPEAKGVRFLLDKPENHQVSIWWHDIETGVLCRGVLDVLNPRGIVVDHKTTTDASKEAFRKQIANLKYHAQMAMYIDGLRTLGQEIHGAVLIAQDKDPPYCVGLYELDPTDLELGRVWYRKQLRRFVACRESGVWPGYTQGIETLRLPAWA